MVDAIAPSADSPTEPYRALVEAVASGAAVLFVGAGSSCKAGYPGWTGLLSILENEARRVNADRVAEVESEGDVAVNGLARASVYKKVLGAAAYANILRTTFGPRMPPHQPAHESLVALPVRHVFTTNYDGVLQSAHQRLMGSPAHTFDADEWAKLSELRLRQTTSDPPRSYVHLHGSVRRPEAIVLAKEDYDGRYHHETRFKTFLREFLVGHRLVFVGFSIEDEEFKHVLREAEASVQGSGPRHFALLPAPATPGACRIQAESMCRMHGVTPVHFDNARGDYNGLWSLIEALRRDVAAEKKVESAVVRAERLPELLAELLTDHPDQLVAATKRLSTLVPRFTASATPINTGAGSNSSVDRDIDAVFILISEGRPDEAIARYEQIRARMGDQLTPKQLYRIDANIGHAHYAKGQTAQASKYYLRAVEYYRESRDALGIEVLGHSVAGDRGTTLRLAAELCDKEPGFARAWSLWVRGHGDDTEFTAVEAQVPESLRSDAEVALSLADLAARTGDFDSHVRHARSAVAASPKWADALAMLGAAIVTTERRHAAFDADRGVVPRDPALLREAEDVITRAIAAVGQHDPGGRLAGMRFNRSVVRRLLGKEVEAYDDLRDAFRLEPAEPIIAVGFAMEAEAPSDVNASIAALERLEPDGEHDDQVSFAKAWLLLRRKADGDIDTAMPVLDRLCSRLGVLTPPLMRADVVRMGLRARLELGRADAGPAFVDDLPSGSLPELQRKLLRARACLQAGLREAAERAASEAVREVGDQASWFDRREAAVLAQDCGLHADALRLWRSALPPGYTGSDTVHLIRSAYLANDWRTVLDVCGAVRAAGCTTRSHLQFEVEVLSACREPERAIALLRSWVAQHPDDKRITLQLSALDLRAGRPDLAVFDATRLPSVAEVAHPGEGAALVYVLRRGPSSANALEAAYALYRRFPDEHDANWTLFACVFDPAAAQLAIDRPTRVGENTASLVGREGEPPRWVYVETAPSPMASRGEFPPSHAFVQAMWGRAAGETFEYLGHVYRVAQVEDRVLRRVHDIMEHYEENFPGCALLRRFNAPVTAAPDAPVKEKLGEVYDVLERQDRNRQLLESMYRKNQLPIASFARLYSRPVFDAVRHLVTDRSLGVRADDGEPRRWPLAIAAAGAAELVLDGTVLAGALVLRILDDLATLGPKLVVPRAVLDEVRQLSLDAASPRSQRGTMGLYQGQFFFHELSPEEIAAEVDRLERVVEFVQTRCEVVGGEATLDLPADLRAKLEELLDTTSVDAVALALRRACPLWTDDLGLQQLLAEIGVRIPITWTQAVAKAAHNAGKLSDEKLHRLHSALLERGYSFTRLSADDIVGVLKTAEWRIDRGAGRALVQVAIEVAFMNPHNAMIVALAFKEVWERCPQRADAKRFVLSVLEGIGEDRGKALASRIYHFRRFWPVVRLPDESLPDAAGAEGTSRARGVTLRVDPFGDKAGRSLKRFLRAWRSRDGEFRKSGARCRRAS